MKTLKKIGLVLAVVLGLGMVTGCDSLATLGMDELTYNDIMQNAYTPQDWVYGNWEGTAKTNVYEITNTSTKKTDSASDSYSVNASSTVGALAFGNILGVIAETATSNDDGFSKVCANSARTHVIYYSQTESTDGNVKTRVCTTYDLKKTK